MDQGNSNINRFRRLISNTTLIRLCLILVILPSAYVATRTSYNFAHWIPHRFLYDLGIPYIWVLRFEQNADWLLHPLIAFGITWLLIHARIPIISQPAIRVFFVVCLACIGLEIYQYLIDRGIETSDLLLGILGSFMAYFASTKTSHQ